MRKMISGNIASKLAVKDGKIGTFISAGSFLRGTSPAASPTRFLKLASGITKLGENWENSGGPYEVSQFEDGSLNLVVIEELGYNNYIVRLGDAVYAPIRINEKATFEGSIVVYPENIQNNEQVEVGKTFKAFKLED